MAMFGKAGRALASPAGQEALYLLGASLKDMSSGGGDNFLLAQQNLGTRRKEADELAAFDGLASTLFGGQTPTLAGGSGSDTLTGAGVGGAGNPGEMGGMTPQMWARVNALRKTRNLEGLNALFQSQEPKYERGPDGFYETRPGQIPRRVTQFEQKPEKPDVPMGMEIGPDGRLRWRDGYVEAQKLLGGIRRDIIVDNPTLPRRGGGGGGAPKRGAQQMTDAELLAIAGAK